MISLLIKIKHKLPSLWLFAERVNGKLAALRFKGLKAKTRFILQKPHLEGFSFSEVKNEDIQAIIDLYSRQQHEYVRNFYPHSFDSSTLESMVANDAYCLMKVTENSSGNIVGYFFIRSFFVGKAFHGLLTDEPYANRGIGATMWKISMDICKSVGLRMFATMAKDNVASYKSAENGTDVNIINPLENDYILIECQPKQTTD